MTDLPRLEWRTDLELEDAVMCMPIDAFDLWVDGKLDIVFGPIPAPPEATP